MNLQNMKDDTDWPVLNINDIIKLSSPSTLNQSTHILKAAAQNLPQTQRRLPNLMS